MNTTHRDNNRDTLLNNEQSKAKILELKEKTRWSWTRIAQKIYNSLQEEPLSSQEETLAIKKFEERLSRAFSKDRATQMMIKFDIDGLQSYEIKKYWEILCQDDDVKKWFHHTVYHDTPMISLDEWQDNLLKINELVIRGLDFAEFWHYIDMNETLFSAFEHRAQTGSALFQTTLGHFYYFYGKNGVQNFKKAHDYYQMAAEHGNQFALYQLGAMYEYGNGVEKDDNVSFRFYKKSADADYPIALNQVAYCYYRGKGVSQDLQMFVEFARQSAHLDDYIGKLLLALAYEKRIGENFDIQAALKLYQELYDCETNVWTFPIGMKLATLYRQTINDESQAEYYFCDAMKKWTEMINHFWFKNQLDKLNFMELSPELIDRFYEYEHYDSVYKPEQTMILKALLPE